MRFAKIICITVSLFVIATATQAKPSQNSPVESMSYKQFEKLMKDPDLKDTRLGASGNENQHWSFSSDEEGLFFDLLIYDNHLDYYVTKDLGRDIPDAEQALRIKFLTQVSEGFQVPHATLTPVFYPGYANYMGYQARFTFDGTYKGKDLREQYWAMWEQHGSEMGLRIDFVEQLLTNKTNAQNNVRMGLSLSDALQDNGFTVSSLEMKKPPIRHEPGNVREAALIKSGDTQVAVMIVEFSKIQDAKSYFERVAYWMDVEYPQAAESLAVDTRSIEAQLKSQQRGWRQVCGDCADWITRSQPHLAGARIWNGHNAVMLTFATTDYSQDLWKRLDRTYTQTCGVCAKVAQ